MTMLVFAVSASLADPLGTSPLVSAADWLQQTLLGTIATAVAVIGVATIGFMALSGRIHIRRAATVLLGCFILFGASGIAAGLKSLGDEVRGPGGVTATNNVAPVSPLPPAPSQAPRNSAYDPYAGASVPFRQ
jgi:type IV secretory pathway VirB2 component (pilin)